MEAYFVDAQRGCEPGGPLLSRMRYVAVAETPQEAVEAVRALVGENVAIEATGATLSMTLARAIGIRAGQARLV